MSRYNLYTALMGVVGVMFSVSIAVGDLSIEVKALLITFGAAVFAHSAWVLYRASSAPNDRPERSTAPDLEPQSISKITLLNSNGESILSWELYGRTALVIGKDVGENHVDIDLSESPYAAMIDVEHAVLNYADGDWYVEDLDSKNGISLRKAANSESYKLSSLEPCKLDFGDVIEVGMCQLKLN